MYLNTFTSGLDPLDMTELEEFASLLKSASELGIPHSARCPLPIGEHHRPPSALPLSRVG